jgi:hypothetical protein
MNSNRTDDDNNYLKGLLDKKHLKISKREIKHKLEQIENSQQIFPPAYQSALMVHLLHNYEKSKRKEVITLEELAEKKPYPTIVLGVMADDWPGMSNAILGIVHHKDRNVPYMKAFTLHHKEKEIGVVILCFQLKTQEEMEQFQQGKKEMVRKIKEAVRGSSGKYQFLDEEAIKFEIYNDIIKRFMELYSSNNLVRIIEEDGEILKFISSCSLEYLEEREINVLANIIINNYINQNIIRSGAAEYVIRIKNFKTKTGELTGITFVCREGSFSVEDFLMTLNHLVPDHIMKKHLSLVTDDGIFVYRVEILDRYQKPLSSNLIKTIEKSMEKIMSIAVDKKYSKLRAIGGIEHYARAIIPFLAQELEKTQLTQLFMDATKKTEFSISIKLILVSFKSRKKRIYDLCSKVCLISGVTISSVIPTKIHDHTEINILRLNINLSEFGSINEIYGSIKKIIRKIYGKIRDFDEGFRLIYIDMLNQLLSKLKSINPSLIREIFFNIDELYKIEVPFGLMVELIRLCARAIEKSEANSDTKVKFLYKNLKEPPQTIVVVSYDTQKRLMSKLIRELKEVELYFTKIIWNQRSYLIMALVKDNKILDKEFISQLKSSVYKFV